MGLGSRVTRMAAATLAAVAVGLLAAAPAALAQVTAEQAGTSVAEAFGVEVLRVEPATGAHGAPAYRVTVMNPPGNRNDAFAVTTLEVDRATGELVKQFRHLPAGYRLAGEETFRPRSYDTVDRARTETRVRNEPR